MSASLDTFDRQILAQLQQDCRVPAERIAVAIGLSATASPLRQRRLDDMRMRQFAAHTQDGDAVRRASALPSSVARRTPPRPRTCVAYNCTWSTPTPARSPSIPPLPG